MGVYVTTDETRCDDDPEVVGVRIGEVDIMLEDFDFGYARDRLAWRLALIAAADAVGKAEHLAFLRESADRVASFLLNYIDEKVAEAAEDGSARAEAEKNCPLSRMKGEPMKFSIESGWIDDRQPDVDVAVDEPDVPASSRASRARPFDGSPQQIAFWDELRTGNGNVVLEARAGAGKSSSCRRGIELLLEDDPTLRIRYCCFNKSIAEEFEGECPEGVDVGTMHRFGARLLTRDWGSRIESTKSYTLLDSIDGGSSLARWKRKAVAKVVSHAKNDCVDPRVGDAEARIRRLITVFAIDVYRARDEIVDYSVKLLEASAKRTDVIDFDDMQWLPAILGLEFPPVDFVFIDEAQDLNPAQHHVARLLGAAGRTVIVGDPYQAIYGWRGAMIGSIETLGESLRAKTMPLTVTWRCPRSHVSLANELVPDLEAAPNAIEGELSALSPGERSAPSAGALVLCRLNAPLISQCLTAISIGRRAKMRGRGIGVDLTSIVEAVHARATIRTRSDFMAGVARWRNDKLELLADKEGVDDKIEEINDQAASLDAIAGWCADVSDIVSAINSLFSDDPSLGQQTIFSSVHRAKGFEADDVYYHQVAHRAENSATRGRPLPSQWEIDQRRNLRYVALTRSRRALTLTS